MAHRTSGDRPADSRNETIEGQQETIIPDYGNLLEDEQALADHEQALADSDQTLADSDQSLSAADQTGADSDQTSADSDQLAADRDQAASNRDLTSGVDPDAHEVSRIARQRTTRRRDQTARRRDETAQARLDAAGRRDAIAHARDLAARARDQAAEACSLASEQREATDARDDGARPLTRTDILIRAAGERKRAEQRRTRAAEQRAFAAQDRQAAAQDREQAAGDRLRSLVDREALARQVPIADTDPLTGARTRAAGLADLDHELDRCRRTSGRLVVAYVAVLGPMTDDDADGDGARYELLRRVVQLIKERVRSCDLIIRLHGHEFLCATAGMTLLDARQRFDAIAAALAAGPDVVAIDTGLAELGHDDTAAELITRAIGELIDGRRDSRQPTSKDTSAR